MTEDDRRLSEIFAEEGARLRSFIRHRVPNEADAEDLFQDVFSKLVEANRLLMPIEHVTGWLYRVARNAVTDLFRKTRPGRFSDPPATDPEGEPSAIEELVPSAEPGPDALLRSSLLLEELELALAELPEEQRFVFVAHELEGRTFKDLSAETGANVNTLLARKRYAVLHLRNRLREFHDETTEE